MLLGQCSMNALLWISKSHFDVISNSLWPSNDIWRHKSRSTLTQVMACCLTAPNHYLNHCLLIIKGVLWYSPESNLTRRNLSHKMCSEIILIISIHPPGTNELRAPHCDVNSLPSNLTNIFFSSCLFLILSLFTQYSWKMKKTLMPEIYSTIAHSIVCSSSQLAPRIGLYTASLVSLTDVLIGWCASDCDTPTHIVTYPNKHGGYPPSPTWRASPTWRKQKAFPLPVEKAGNSLLFSEAADSPMLADMGRETVYP